MINTDTTTTLDELLDSHAELRGLMLPGDVAHLDQSVAEVDRHFDVLDIEPDDPEIARAYLGLRAVAEAAVRAVPEQQECDHRKCLLMALVDTLYDVIVAAAESSARKVA